MLTSSVLCLALTIYHEARGEPTIGQQAVVEVVLNRSNKRDKSVCDVVYEPKQFSWSSTKGVPKPNRDWDFSVDLARSYLAGEKKTSITNGAQYFHTNSIPLNCKAKNVKRIGNHVFYNIGK